MLRSCFSQELAGHYFSHDKTCLNWSSQEATDDQEESWGRTEEQVPLAASESWSPPVHTACSPPETAGVPSSWNCTAAASPHRPSWSLGAWENQPSPCSSDEEDTPNDRLSTDPFSHFSVIFIHVLRWPWGVMQLMRLIISRFVESRNYQVFQHNRNLVLFLPPFTRFIE